MSPRLPPPPPPEDRAQVPCHDRYPRASEKVPAPSESIKIWSLLTPRAFAHACITLRVREPHTHTYTHTIKKNHGHTTQDSQQSLHKTTLTPKGGQGKGVSGLGFRQSVGKAKWTLDSLRVIDGNTRDELSPRAFQLYVLVKKIFQVLLAAARKGRVRTPAGGGSAGRQVENEEKGNPKLVGEDSVGARSKP